VLSQLEDEYLLPIIDLRVKRGALHSGSFFGGILRVLRLLFQHRWDAVITFSHSANILISPIAALRRIPRRISSQRMSLSSQSRLIRIADRLVVNMGLSQSMV